MAKAKKATAKSTWKISVKKLTKVQLRQLNRMRRGGYGIYHCIDDGQSGFSGCTKGGHAGTITTD